MKIRTRQPLAGGDICRVERVELEDGRIAVLKTHSAAPSGFFAAEAWGLSWLRETSSLRLPEVLELGEQSLLLEWLPPSAPRPDFDEFCGRGLAALHAYPEASLAGLDQDNFIGPLHQSNRSHPTWPEFYAEQRLLPLVEKAVKRGLGHENWTFRFQRLARKLSDWLPQEPLSRLHGDLWSGNLLVGPGGQPCLIDPAVYVGQREVDLAMMRLFGGFGARVFSAYEEAYPLQPGAAERVPLYQLYPLLVHVLLFGGGYAGAVDEALRKLP
ncbi:fructosamine kinase family protein [bacterium]|nr:fructosamine kinase family protein [bacterium]